MKEITINLGERSYPIFIKRGLLSHVHECMNLQRKVLIVTDDGVPPMYAQCVMEQCKKGWIHTVPQGEGSKSFDCLQEICTKLLKKGFSRGDCVVAVGGGVVGDLAGFAASAYMRGIDFYNIPTTTLSQIDSSVGGKVAVNLCGVKNIVGAFHQPRAVVIDGDTLQTLPHRHVVNGLMEGLKCGLIGDEKLFRLFQTANPEYHIDEIVFRSISLKKKIVEEDEWEGGVRKILNFGHTIGHGLESSFGLSSLYHGECVALGMLPMIRNAELRAQTREIMEGMGINTSISFDAQQVYEALTRDKKIKGDTITAVLVEKLGCGELVNMPVSDFQRILREEME